MRVKSTEFWCALHPMEWLNGEQYVAGAANVASTTATGTATNYISKDTDFNVISGNSIECAIAVTDAATIYCNCCNDLRLDMELVQPGASRRSHGARHSVYRKRTVSGSKRNRRC